MFSDVSPENISASTTYTGTAAFAFNAPTTITMNTNESWYCTFSGPLFRTSRNTTPTRTPMSIALPKIARSTSRFLRASRASRENSTRNCRHAHVTRVSRGRAPAAVIDRGDVPGRAIATSKAARIAGATKSSYRRHKSFETSTRAARPSATSLSLSSTGSDEIERVLRDRDPARLRVPERGEVVLDPFRRRRRGGAAAAAVQRVKHAAPAAREQHEVRERLERPRARRVDHARERARERASQSRQRLDHRSRVRAAQSARGFVHEAHARAGHERLRDAQPSPLPAAEPARTFSSSPAVRVADDVVRHRGETAELDRSSRVMRAFRRARAPRFEVPVIRSQRARERHRLEHRLVRA